MTDDDRRNAKLYHDKAEEIRTVAETMSLRENRDALLSTAALWDRLAAKIEEGFA